MDYQPRHREADVREGAKAYHSGHGVKAASEHLEVVEDGVIAACQAAAKKYDSIFEIEVSPIQEAIKDDRQRLEDGLLKQEANLNNSHELALEKLDSEWGSDSPRQKTTRETLYRLRQREAFVLGEVNGRPPRYGNAYFYAIFMLLLTLAEIPVNSSAFVLFFRETPLLATLVAFLCGLLLVFLAHASGQILRQFAYNQAKHSFWGPAAALVLIILVTAFLAFGLALLRQGYVDYILARRLTPGVAEMLAQGEYRSVLFRVAANGLRADGLIFLSINATIVAVGVVASYFKHDPHPDYETVDRGIRRRQKQMSAIQQTHARKQARLMSIHQQAHNAVLINIQTAQSDLNQQEGKLVAELKERQADLELVHMVMRQRVLAYRQGYMGAAADDGVDGIYVRPIPGLSSEFTSHTQSLAHHDDDARRGET